MKTSTKVSLILCLVAGLGAGGLLYAGRLAARSEAPQPNVQSDQGVRVGRQKTLPQVKRQNTLPARSSQAYMDIHKWGVRFLVPERLRGDVVVVLDDDPNLTIDAVHLVSAKYAAAITACRSAPHAERLNYKGFVSLFREDHRSADSVRTTIPAPLFERDGYGYYRVANTCEADPLFNAQAHTEAQLLVDAFASSLQSM